LAFPLYPIVMIDFNLLTYLARSYDLQALKMITFGLEIELIIYNNFYFSRVTNSPIFFSFYIYRLFVCPWQAKCKIEAPSLNTFL